MNYKVEWKTEKSGHQPERTEAWAVSKSKGACRARGGTKIPGSALRHWPLDDRRLAVEGQTSPWQKDQTDSTWVNLPRGFRGRLPWEFVVEKKAWRPGAHSCHCNVSTTKADGIPTPRLPQIAGKNELIKKTNQTIGEGIMLRCEACADWEQVQGMRRLRADSTNTRSNVISEANRRVWKEKN